MFKKSNISKEAYQTINSIEQDHATALSSARLGKALVRKTVTMINGGTDSKTFVSPRLALGRAEAVSTTLALNSELAERGIDATAQVTREWNHSTGHDADQNVLRITEFEGQTVTDHAIPPIRR